MSEHRRDMEATRGNMRDHGGNMREHEGNMEGTSREHLENIETIQGTSREHLGNTEATSRNSTGTLKVSREHPGTSRERERASLYIIALLQGAMSIIGLL